MYLLAELDCVVCVFESLEAHQLLAFPWLVDVAPVYTAWNDLVVCLQNDGTVLEVLVEVLYHRLDVQGVEPQSKDTGFALALGIEVVNLSLLLLGNGLEARVCVEQVCDKSQVELGVAGYERCRCQELAAVEGVGILEDAFGALEEVGLLERGAGAGLGRELVEQDRVVLAILDVGGEVGNTI